jgi:transcriptional regulator with XRE-family HTH domain
MRNYRKAKKIEKLRRLREKPQKWMAHELGIAQSTYSDWESGDVDISDERTEQIAKILGTTAEWLNSPDDVELVMNHNHGNNGYNVIQNQQQHLVSEEFLKQITEQLTTVIKDQNELLKETQKDRSRMLDLLDHWARAQKTRK